jgi:hypothetical protein
MATRRAEKPQTSRAGRGAPLRAVMSLGEERRRDVDLPVLKTQSSIEILDGSLKVRKKYLREVRTNYET